MSVSGGREGGLTGREHFTGPRRPASEGRPVGRDREKNRGKHRFIFFTNLLLL